MTVGDISRTRRRFSGQAEEIARDDLSNRQILGGDRNSDQDRSESELLMVELAAGHAVETEVLRQGLVSARADTERLAGELALSARQRTRLAHDRVIAEARLTAADAALAEARERLSLAERELGALRATHMAELEDVVARADRAEADHAFQLAGVQRQADGQIAEVRENCRLAVASASRTEAQARAQAAEAEERLETLLNAVDAAQVRAREVAGLSDVPRPDEPN